MCDRFFVQTRAAKSKMSFEEAKQYLRTEDKDGGSLYEHLSKVLLKIITEKPGDANAMFEEISAGLRTTAPKKLPLEGDVDELKPAKEAQLGWCASIGKLYDQEEGEASYPDLMTEANVFEWAGLQLGRTETYRLYLGIKAKALAEGGKLKFWGKILTRGPEDYYVIQGENPDPPSSDDVQTIEGAEGTNKDAFWVATRAGGDWIRLPNVTPEAIVAARQLKKFLTGDLSAPVPSYPVFPGGTEAHYLRAQIALINADCAVSPDGFYAEDDEADDDIKKIKPVDEIEEYKTIDDLKSPANWKHHELPINSNGRCNQPPAQEDEDEPQEPPAEDLPVLAAIDNDEPGWHITACPGGPGESPDSIVIAKSLTWPGAVAAAFGNKFLNVYCGFGYKASRGAPYQPPRAPPIQAEWAPNLDGGDKDLIEDTDVISQPVVEQDDDEDA